MKTFSHDNSWNYFEELLKQKISAKDAWENLIDFHEKVKEKIYWKDLTNINVISEQKEVKHWLQSIVLKNPIPNEVRALWIGITKFEDQNLKKEIFAIYLQGSASYDAEEIDWASDPIYEPEGAYVALKNLNLISQFLESDKVDAPFLIQLLPLAYCSFLLDEIFQSQLDKEKFTFYKSKLYITTGYDSGAYQNLSILKK